MGGGLFFWTEERDDVALWTTEDSPIRVNSRWVDEHFSHDHRYESVIISADNILQVDVLLFVSATNNISDESSFLNAITRMRQLKIEKCSIRWQN